METPTPAATSTGRLSSASSPSPDSDAYEQHLAHIMLSPQSPQQRRNMYGRIKRQSLGQGLNWETYQCSEILLRVGMPYETSPNREHWIRSKPIYTFDITAPSAESLKITSALLQSNELWSCIGVQQVLGSQEGLGGRQVHRHILKIQGRNFGMAIEVEQMLFWMNFVEPLTSPMYSDGLTDTLFSWKLKVHHKCCRRAIFGLQVTCTHDSGIQISTN